MWQAVYIPLPDIWTRNSVVRMACLSELNHSLHPHTCRVRIWMCIISVTPTCSEPAQGLHYNQDISSPLGFVVTNRLCRSAKPAQPGKMCAVTERPAVGRGVCPAYIMRPTPRGPRSQVASPRVAQTQPQSSCVHLCPWTVPSALGKAGSSQHKKHAKHTGSGPLQNTAAAVAEKAARDS